MTFERLRRDLIGPWSDARDDDLPARIESLVAADEPVVHAAVEARRAIVLAAFRAGTPTQAAGSGRAAVRFPLQRRWAFALTTAVLLLVFGVAGVAASSAGGPLYGLRLATEEAFLPAHAADRVAAQLERLDRRIGEAEGAATSDNPAGVDAALTAYRGIIATVEAAHPESLGLAADTRLRFQDRLAGHVRRLERLRDADPAAVSITIDAGRRLGERMGGPQERPGGTDSGNGSGGEGSDGNDSDGNRGDGNRSDENGGAPRQPGPTGGVSPTSGGHGPTNDAPSSPGSGGPADAGCGSSTCR